ncbi:MAG: hypothetical protein AMK70_11090 [Nitrospira bacterium SG8_35_1]|nr:MAG: hypothetical protein AMK70_11090 [Nitrospira bacterium SG8_35_1]
MDAWHKTKVFIELRRGTAFLRCTPRCKQGQHSCKYCNSCNLSTDLLHNHILPDIFLKTFQLF